MMTTKDAFDAIKHGDLDALTAALDAGADSDATNAHGWSLLMWAVYFNRLDMVDVLLSRGANVHLKDLYGQTALHFAARKWRSDDMFRRIFSEAGPRAMNYFPDCNGWTPLHELAQFGSAEQMAFALSHPGIDVSIRDRHGRMPPVIAGIASQFPSVLKAYGDEEARWQPIRYTWIKLLMLPTR
jgi:ankyrin repeat protein